MLWSAGKLVIRSFSRRKWFSSVKVHVQEKHGRIGKICQNWMKFQGFHYLFQTAARIKYYHFQFLIIVQFMYYLFGQLVRTFPLLSIHIWSWLDIKRKNQAHKASDGLPMQCLIFAANWFSWNPYSPVTSIIIEVLKGSSPLLLCSADTAEETYGIILLLTCYVWQIHWTAECAFFTYSRAYCEMCACWWRG